MAKDMIERTEGVRKAAEAAIYQAYERGYKDGEKAEHDRKLEMLLKEKKGKWIEEKVLFQYQEITVWRCDQCGRLTNDWSDKYCSGCGARMEESDG